MEIRPEHEEELLKRMRIRTRAKLPCLVLADRGPIDEEARPFEVFDLFFAAPASCGESIDPHTVDGFGLIEMLIDGAVNAITNRFKQLLPGFNGPISAIGISTELQWFFGQEVPEAEAMLGDLWDSAAIPGCLTFYARFIAPVDQFETRCRTAPITLPPPASLQPAPWARGASTEEEELEDPPLSWFEQD